jgi:hypothetical protein
VSGSHPFFQILNWKVVISHTHWLLNL